VYKHLRHEIGAKGYILLTAIFLDVAILGAFIFMRLQSDPFIAIVAVVSLLIVFIGEWLYLRSQNNKQRPPAHEHGDR